MTSHCAAPQPLRDTVAGQIAPDGSQPRSTIKPSERYQRIAFRLNVTQRQAEMLWLLAQQEVIPTDTLCGRMGLGPKDVSVYAYNLRKRGFAVSARKYVGYSISLADRERIVAVASAAPVRVQAPHGVVSSQVDLAGSANAAGPFQFADDPTRQVSKSHPSHPSPPSSLEQLDNRSCGECCVNSGTLHP